MSDATYFWRACRTGRTRPRGRAPEPTRPGTPPPRTSWRIARRGLLRALFASATVAFTAAALSRIPSAEPYGEPTGSAGPERGTGPEGSTFDEMYAGHRIQGWPVQTGAAEIAVFVDGRQLNLMRRADGGYLSSVDHYASYATAREAARAAAAELGAARLSSVPVHGSHERGADRGVHA
ncbi:tyrosinase co-factor protein [Streptomyces sp. SDr-06]|uniref:tyrosinase family oxidase copper chaperone n=1 Tax=Streptomyces sp. SDr-06 TaxID=2267702 RepID=UPI000DEACF46|nr:tyrosinase family oxidase copper chaperone [Streptomyces sp. SDr-06]RCH65423.1 tyrosinase co-factor protein [Streptomyces sp. SDr-06]